MDYADPAVGFRSPLSDERYHRTFRRNTVTAGHYIVMDHGNGHRTRYIHQNAPGVADGRMVARGQVIGYEGNLGYTVPDDYYQLHFETRHGATTFSCGYDGTAVDPYAASTYMWKTNPPGTARDLDFSGDGYPDVLGREKWVSRGPLPG